MENERTAVALPAEMKREIEAFFYRTYDLPPGTWEFTGELLAQATIEKPDGKVIRFHPVGTWNFLLFKPAGEARPWHEALPNGIHETEIRVVLEDGANASPIYPIEVRHLRLLFDGFPAEDIPKTTVAGTAPRGEA